MSNLNTPQRRTIAINAAGGAVVLVSASIFCGYAEIQECPPGSEAAGGVYTGGNFNPQGLNIQRADENFANTYGLAPGAIWPIGDAINKSKTEGIPGFTYPDQSVRPPTPWVKVISATAVATQIEVREWRAQR